MTITNIMIKNILLMLVLSYVRLSKEQKRPGGVVSRWDFACMVIATNRGEANFLKRKQRGRGSVVKKYLWEKAPFEKEIHSFR